MKITAPQCETKPPLLLRMFAGPLHSCSCMSAIHSGSAKKTVGRQRIHFDCWPSVTPNEDGSRPVSPLHFAASSFQEPRPAVEACRPPPPGNGTPMRSRYPSALSSLLSCPAPPVSRRDRARTALHASGELPFVLLKPSPGLWRLKHLLDKAGTENQLGSHSPSSVSESLHSIYHVGRVG